MTSSGATAALEPRRPRRAQCCGYDPGPVGCLMTGGYPWLQDAISNQIMISLMIVDLSCMINPSYIIPSPGSACWLMPGWSYHQWFKVQCARSVVRSFTKRSWLWIDCTSETGLFLANLSNMIEFKWLVWDSFILPLIQPLFYVSNPPQPNPATLIQVCLKRTPFCRLYSQFLSQLYLAMFLWQNKKF